MPLPVHKCSNNDTILLCLYVLIRFEYMYLYSIAHIVMTPIL